MTKHHPPHGTSAGPTSLTASTSARARTTELALLALLPALSFAPGVAASFGLPVEFVLIDLLMFSGGQALLATRGHVETVPALLWLAPTLALVALAEGPAPIAWVPVYFGAILIAQSDRLVKGFTTFLLVSCAFVSGWRFAHQPVPMAATLANAVFPALLYRFLAGHTLTLARASAAIARAQQRMDEMRATARRRGRAEDIHDGVGASLTAALLQAEVLARPSDADATARQQHRLERIAGCVRDAHEQLVTAASPAPRSSVEAKEMLERLASSLCEPTRVDARIALDHSDLATVPPELWAFLFRAAREAIVNAVRHSGGERLWVRVTGDTERVALTVEDDGRGPDSAGPGFGLRHLERRAKARAGRVTLTAREDRGARFHLELPIVWPEPPSLARESPARRPSRYLVLGVALMASLLAVLPEHPVFAASTHLPLGLRITFALAITASTWAQIHAGRMPRGAIWVGPLVAHVVLAIAIVDSGRPASFVWLLVLIQLWVQARAFPPRQWLYALTLLSPLGIALGFVATGHPWDSLGAPIFLLGACPILYSAIVRAAQARRGVALRRTRLQRELRAAALERQERVLGARVLRPLETRLEDARAQLAIIGSGGATLNTVAAQRLVATLRAALNRLRAAIWAFDPELSRWETLRPYVRALLVERSPSARLADRLDDGLPFDPGARLALVAAIAELEQPTTVQVELRGAELVIAPRAGADHLIVGRVVRDDDESRRVVGDEADRPELDEPAGWQSVA